MAKLHLAIEGVDIAPAYLGCCDVSGFLQVSQDHRGAPLSDANIGGDIFNKALRITAEIDQDVAMVGEEGPLPLWFALLCHAGNIPEM